MCILKHVEDVKDRSSTFVKFTNTIDDIRGLAQSELFAATTRSLVNVDESLNSRNSKPLCVLLSFLLAKCCHFVVRVHARESTLIYCFYIGTNGLGDFGHIDSIEPHTY